MMYLGLAAICLTEYAMLDMAEKRSDNKELWAQLDGLDDTVPSLGLGIDVGLAMERFIHLVTNVPTHSMGGLCEEVLSVDYDHGRKAVWNGITQFGNSLIIEAEPDIPDISSQYFCIWGSTYALEDFGRVRPRQLVEFVSTLPSAHDANDRHVYADTIKGTSCLVAYRPGVFMKDARLVVSEARVLDSQHVKSVYQNDPEDDIITQLLSDDGVTSWHISKRLQISKKIENIYLLTDDHPIPLLSYL